MSRRDPWRGPGSWFWGPGGEGSAVGSPWAGPVAHGGEEGCGCVNSGGGLGIIESLLWLAE